MADAAAESEDIKRLEAQILDLRTENKHLKTPAKQPEVKSRHLANILRKFGVVTFLCISVALLTSANLFFWFGNTIVKPDRFVAATQPIITNPVVQNTMALYATNSIFNNIDVQKHTAEVLPPRADFLAPQLTNQLKSFTQSTFQKVLANPSFQTKWNNVLARQHQRLITFASKYQGDGDISLNDVFKYMTGSLTNTKLAFLADKQLPAKVGDINVINAAWLPAFHNLVVNIDTWRLLTVILMVVALAAAIWLSRNRRKTVYWFSTATAAMMLATLVALHITRESIIGKVDPQYQGGVRQVIQIVFHSLAAQTVTIMALAIFVGLVAWITSTSNSAIRLRRHSASLFSGRLHQQVFGSSTDGITGWVQDHKSSLEWLSVTIFGAVMLMVRLTLKAFFIYVLALVASVLLIEFVGGQREDYLL
jgi:hypothetical protein